VTSSGVDPRPPVVTHERTRLSQFGHRVGDFVDLVGDDADLSNPDAAVGQAAGQPGRVRVLDVAGEQFVADRDDRRCRGHSSSPTVLRSLTLGATDESSPRTLHRWELWGRAV